MRPKRRSDPEAVPVFPGFAFGPVSPVVFGAGTIVVAGVTRGSSGLRKCGRPCGHATGRSLYAKPDVGSLYTLIRFDPIEEIYLEFRCRGVNCQLV